MDANPQVMPPVMVHAARPTLVPRESGTEKSAKPQLEARAEPRVSEDPMRRTDRYRLVMPWAARV